MADRRRGRGRRPVAGVEPVVVGPDEGEVIYDGPGGGFWILGAEERLVLSRFRLDAGMPGPAPHVHHHHADAFYVLEGELTVRLGDEEAAIGAGGFVRIPPNVVHTYRNHSDAPVRGLNLHAPATGFDAYLRAGRDGDEEARRRFDQHEPPPDGGRPGSDAKVLAAGEGEQLAFGPSSLIFKATGDDEGAHFSLSVSTAAPGFPGPPPHVHRSFVDSFYVLEGTLTLLVAGEQVSAGPGTFAMVPPGNEHTFSNSGDAPVRFLNLMAPGGFERNLREAAAP